MLAAGASDSAQPGTLAFLVIFGMAVVLFFLFRSMSKHLRKVNSAARQQQDAAAGQEQDPAGEPPGGTPVGGTSASAGPSPGDTSGDVGQNSPPRSRRITG
jgi:flagellar biosynthesis/type III secretory pathway M-ring protein FliF/YscJ